MITAMNNMNLNEETTPQPPVNSQNFQPEFNTYSEYSNFYTNTDAQDPYKGYKQKNYLTTLLLGFFLGAFGAHNFYLGFTTKAYFQIVFTLATCGLALVWGLVDSVMYAFGIIDTDANGVPLKKL